ncbi:hypothetical protein SAMN06298216_1686 [Spirosomataceae bacterium TFI 002]|nr:hypothetical protein SAMN06298216_1686 [Spirosomataceae bacterium TFI 002]
MNRISLVIQEGALKSYFPDSQVSRVGEKELIWKGTLKPTALSPTYTIKLHYKTGKNPTVYVINPKPLKLPEGKDQLPHVYSTKHQQLCLYYPKDKEWNPSMLYVRSLIPWTSEWLLHYEIFVCTGVWHGGGVDHDPSENKL